jgi:hypothetical protein
MTPTELFWLNGRAILPLRPGLHLAGAFYLAGRRSPRYCLRAAKTFV